MLLFNHPKIPTFPLIPSPHLQQRTTRHLFPHSPSLIPKVSFSPSSPNPLRHFPSCKATLNEENSIKEILVAEGFKKDEVGEAKTKEKTFWGAVSLIIGTAVGPGMLGLPAATIRSGPVPSSIAIILCWVYVISSIVLVAELSFAAMEENDGEEEYMQIAFSLEFSRLQWLGFIVQGRDIDQLVRQKISCQVEI